MVEAKKIAKKKWYPIEGPAYLGNKIIGETLISNPEKLIGRKLTANLMAITRDLKKQNVNVKFEIVKVEKDKAITEVIGYEIIPTAIRRLVRRGLKKIELSFLCTTSDNKNVVIKPLILIRITCPGSVQSLIRKKTKEILARVIKKIDYETLVQNLLGNKIQPIVKAQIKRLYPHRTFEIRYMSIVKGEVKHVEPVIEEQAKEENKEQ